MSIEIKRRGLMLILSSPSGAGKTTLARLLLEQDKDISLSVSATTRPQRANEDYGIDYYFLKPEEFDQWHRDGKFLEHAIVFGNRYGTQKEHVERTLESGRDMLFDIDWQGTQQIKQAMPNDIVTVFVLPPSHDELERRLRNRAMDTHDVVTERMAKAASEMKHHDEYDFIVLNDDVHDALADVQAILRAERKRRTRLIGVGEFVAELTK